MGEICIPELLDAISDLLRVGVCTVEARPGSIRVTVFVGVVVGVELGIGDGERPKRDSAAEIFDF